jgi:hypothetical protein
MDNEIPGTPDEPGQTGEQPTPVALAVTDAAVELRVGLVEDERTPEGMICMGTYRGERLVARCVMPPEAWQQVQEYGLFDEPVKVVLVAREAAPGLQCQLYAMVPVPEVEDDEEVEEEPWAASVPGAGYEAAVAGDADEEDDDEVEGDEEVTPLPLGNIVRFARDRVYPESLPHEAADILMKVIEGKTSEVVDRALADLLGL